MTHAETEPFKRANYNRQRGIALHSDKAHVQSQWESLSKRQCCLNKALMQPLKTTPTYWTYSGKRRRKNTVYYAVQTYRKTSDRSPRLLSVQVCKSTPGLYPGPGVYPGPGLYHNMSSLCYFIKKIINFLVYGYQYFVYFHTKSYIS